MSTLQELLDKYAALGQGKTLDDKIELNRQFREEFRQLPTDVQEAYTLAQKERIDQMKEDNSLELKAETALLKHKGSIVYLGIEYPLGEWVTVADYCRMHNQKPNTVMNWIARGIVPESDMIVIPELNNLKLLRNTPYRQAS